MSAAFRPLYGALFCSQYSAESGRESHHRAFWIVGRHVWNVSMIALAELFTHGNLSGHFKRQTHFECQPHKAPKHQPISRDSYDDEQHGAERSDHGGVEEGSFQHVWGSSEPVSAT